MANEVSLYNVVISLGPALVVAAVSIITLRINYRNQKCDKNKELTLNKLEVFYDRLIKIDGEISAKRSSYINDKRNTISKMAIEKIVKDISGLKNEGLLYFGLDRTLEMMSHAEGFLSLLLYENNACLYDGETEEIDGRVEVIVPSTFDVRYDNYRNIYEYYEDSIIKIASKELGGKKRRMPFLKLAKGKTQKKNLVNASRMGKSLKGHLLANNPVRWCD